VSIIIHYAESDVTDLHGGPASRGVAAPVFVGGISQERGEFYRWRKEPPVQHGPLWATYIDESDGRAGVSWKVGFVFV
jgi:hypothetical protein